MKKILLLALALTNTAFAQSLRMNNAQQFLNANAPRNYVLNSGAESNVLNITNASSIVTRTTSVPLEGDASFSIDATATSQLVVFLGAALQSGLHGGNCQGSFLYSGDGSLYSAYATLNGVQVSAAQTLINVAFGSQLVVLSFPCGVSTTDVASVVIASTGDGAIIKVDSVYSGALLGIGSASITTTPVAYTPVFTGFGTVTAINFRSWRVGSMLHIQGTFTPGTTTATEARVTLGFNGVSANVTSASTLPTLQSVGKANQNSPSTTDFSGRTVLAEASRNYVMFGAETSARNGITKYNADTIFSTGQVTSFFAEIQIEGWVGETVLRGDVTSLVGTARSSQTASCEWIYNSGASLAAFAADADCPTMAVTGNLAGPATKIPGFIATALLPGTYQVIANSSFTASPSSSGSTACLFDIFDGTTSGGSQMISQVVTTYRASTSVISGVFTYTSAQASRAFQIRSGRATGNGDCRVSNNDADLTFTLIPLNQALPQPFIPGSVFTASSGIEAIARVRFGGASTRSSCVSTPCTVYSSTPGAVVSVTRASAGLYTVNFTAGVFSAPPTCAGISKGVGVGDSAVVARDTESTATAYDLATTTLSVVRDSYVELVCSGPK